MEPAPKRYLRNTSPEVRGGWRLINRRQIKPDPGPLWPTLKRGMGEPRAARFVGCRFEGSWLPYPASKILPETWVGGAGKRPRDGPPCKTSGSAKYSLHAHQTRSYLPGPIQRAADCRDPRNHSCEGERTLGDRGNAVHTTYNMMVTRATLRAGGGSAPLTNTAT